MPFNHDILEERRHRPWPMPAAPWVMTQTWHDLLFAHWPVELSALRDKIPRAFPIDTFDGRAWVGVVPFHMSNVAPRLVPALPWISAFPELNVRTYVTVGGKPGVFFFSLDAARALAVATARTLLRLPYYTADMAVRLGDGVQYSSRRRSRRSPPADFEAQYAPSGPAAPPTTGSLEYFLTERYCLYAIGPAGNPYRLEIHHPPWPLQPAHASIAVNTMAAASGLTVPDLPPLLHFAKLQDMVCWAPERLTR